MKANHPFSFRVPELAEDEVHLWRCGLAEASAELGRRFALLAEDEQKRADRFKVEGPRQQFIIARSALRSLLGCYLKMAPEELAFQTSEHGKPSLFHPAGKLEFNVSHSHEMVLLAFARTRPVGIDIEWIGRSVNHAEISERFFSQREQSQLKALPPENRPRAFIDCWTRKEAYLKARGFGLSRDPRTFSVSIAADFEVALLEDLEDPAAPGSWSIQPIPLGPRSDYCASLATRSSPGAVKCHCLW